MGRYAAIVKVDLVINYDASLWRPTADMVLMGDALNANIAWPINRIESTNKPAQEATAREEIPAREAVMRRSSQVSLITFCFYAIFVMFAVIDGLQLCYMLFSVLGYK